MQQIADWLKKLGMSEYAQRFADNDIDVSVLRYLTDQDLEKIGVSLGHRRKMLAAIAELSGVAPVTSQPAAIPERKPQDDAERRQLTVMFCDLVGSTELSRRLDPEDLRELIRRYHDAVSGVVVRHGGYVANFLGDGIVAYFGWPRADEDEAAQAIRAGLNAVATVRQLELEDGERLSSRVGIASGMVVVGDLDAAGRRQTGAVAGDTPNLAARLQALAGADQVMIDGLTRQLVGSGFVLHELGPQLLKGFGEPIPTARVLAERATESRFEARKSQLTPFVGRKQEMALLIERFERVVAGEGQAVLLSGEAGIGKSRLVQMLCERLAQAQVSGRPHTRITMQCSPFHTTSTLYPVLRHLEHSAGFLRDDQPAARFRKLETLLRQSMANPAESLVTLAPLFALSSGSFHAAEELLPQHAAMVLSPEQREARALNILVDQLLHVATRSPVVLILEDAHWIDPATQELVAQILARISDARVLLVITHRPEFHSDWTRHPQVTALTLNRLSRGQSAEIARAAAAAALTEAIVARILRRADGVPLFIEELTRSVVEAGSAAEDSVIPETLQASLLARLDRLGSEVREIAQIAAVIGREFTSELLCAVAGKPKDALTPALSQLVTSQIVLQAGAAQSGTYLFRHALIQDAAYQSLLVSRRRQYHVEIARTLESRFAETVEGRPELIAQHYTAAAAMEKAIPYWMRAGERALARSAYREAIAHFERGLALARGLADEPDRSRQILSLLLLLGEARLRNRRLQEALQAFREAFELARSQGSQADLARAALGAEYAESYTGATDYTSVPLLENALDALGAASTPDRARVLSRLGYALARSGKFERAITLIGEASELARRLGDPRALLDALAVEGFATTGQPLPARQFAARRRLLGEMWNIGEQLGDPDLLPHVFSVSMAGFLEIADLAGFEAQLARFEELLGQAQIVGDQNQYLMTSASTMRAILHGDFVAAERLAERALEVAHDIQTEIVTGVYGVQMFTIRREQGRLAEIAPLMRRFVVENQDAAWRPGLALIATDLGFEQAAKKAFDDMALAGFDFPVDAKRNLTLCYLAEVCSRLGDRDRAGRLFELLLPYRDLALVAPAATVCCGAIARYLGMLARLMRDWPVAEQEFQAALAMDERLEAWPWLAHTKHELALMLLVRGGPGDRNRAEALLAEAAASAERFGMASLQTTIRAIETTQRLGP